MDSADMKRWHEKRETLFPTKLPYSAITTINAQLPKLDAERADRALVAYSEARPYRGFYMLKYMVWYERVGDAERRPPFSGTDSAPERAAAPATNDDDGWDGDAERREREAYAALPDDFLAMCRQKLHDWGWPMNSRGWRIMCLDAYVGREIAQYRLHPMFGSAERDRLDEMKRREAERERLGLESIISAMNARIAGLEAELGRRVDVTA